ncbi:hypothetical protein J3458_019587 [Metarhizium acridum]|uniref:uncharacterized protein n=1 Tax=Metarhizium acridum TaxID=92637 RepID=UPI001C6B291D|nr:hypothetical protein J3458_019587 [Metarhizium acridum]
MAEVSKWRRFNISAGQGGGGGDDDDDAKESQSWFTLKHLVYNFWTFVAFDPRDMVFAYYGLLNQYAAERHRADYGMGLVAIYTAATRDLIRSEASLAALSCCGLQYVPPKTTPDDQASSLLRERGHFIGRVSAVGGRSGTRPNEKLAFDLSWLKLPLSLRGKGGYLPGASLSCILWTTLCMDTSPGGMFDPSVLGDKAHSAQGVDFRIFVLLGILAAGDALIRERLGLEDAATRHGDLVFSHLDYDPMKEDLEPVLADLDAFAEHDGDQCWLPTRAEVLRC